MFAGIMWNYEALLSYLAELLALQMLEELLKPFQLSVGSSVSLFLWSSVIIWLNEEPPHVSGSSNDSNISAGCCSAALEAEEELWAWSRTAPPTMTLMAPYQPPPPPL